jgi:predicted SAM-dependent methyltransferase
VTIKQGIGRWLIPTLPVNKHVFDHVRAELTAMRVRLLQKVHPAQRRSLKRFAKAKGLKANIGCGPFGKPGWVNLDTYGHAGVTLRSDCRRRIPLSDRSCIGVHVEHFFEHLNPPDEVPPFLAECRRVLAPGGVLRIIVPDGEMFIRSYMAEGWSEFERIGIHQRDYATKMDALNHVFIQGYEHFACYDFETLSDRLLRAGFTSISRETYGQGQFPGGCIDREQHRPYSLYAEAINL